MTAQIEKNDKYKILHDQSIQHNGRTLYRIRALKDIRSNVKRGDLGGWVQGEHNLSSQGECWIYLNAKVYDDARVHTNAAATGMAEIFERARVGCSTLVADRAKVYGDARVSSHYVFNDAQVCGNAEAGAFTTLTGNAKLHGTAYLAFEEGLSGNEEVACREDFLRIRQLGPRP